MNRQSLLRGKHKYSSSNHSNSLTRLSRYRFIYYCCQQYVIL
ncbi:MAG: hypothetical protein ACI84O_000802 [Myxococcota bacterium]